MARDKAHDPRTAPGAKAKATAMKAKAATFDKPKAQAVAKNGNGKSRVSGPMGSGLLEGARRAMTSRPGVIDRAVAEQTNGKKS